jgi:hypothetical protein
MRPEDRKPSKRVFPLLQNLDLDSVTFAQLQSTGNPISIEDMNEQEMVDLIIVNLARLVVAGEWDGLLEAGGGIMSPTPMKAQAYSSSTDQFVLGNGQPWGATASSTAVGSELSSNYTLFRPFISPNSGDVGDVVVYVATAAAGEALEFGIWANDDDTGLPTGDALTHCSFPLDSTGIITQDSLTGTATLVRGTQYHFGYVADTSSTSARVNGFDVSTIPTLGVVAANPLQQRTMIYDQGGTANQLDTTITTTTADWSSKQYDVAAFSVTFT